MMDEERLYTALGSMQEAINTIKENTKPIPDLILKVDRLETQNKYMLPIVKRQQKALWVGGSILSMAWAGLLAWVEGGHKVP